MSIEIGVGVDLRGAAHAFDGAILATTLPRAYAPGAPLSLTLLEGVSVRGKALGSRRRDDGSFDVRVRLLNLRREDREALAQALAG